MRLSAFVLSLTAAALLATAARSEIASRITDATVHQARVLVLPTGARDIVTLRASLPAGDALARLTGANPAVATLAGEMLDEGTAQRDRFEIANALESVGAQLDFTVRNDYLHVTGRCLRKDLPLLIELLAEQLREPALEEAQLASVKARLIGALQRAMDDTDHVAEESFNNAIYSPAHPNYQVPLREFITATQRATIEDVRQFHQQHYGPRGMVCVFVGDVAPDEILALLHTALSGWSGGSEVASAAEVDGLPAGEAEVVEVNMADKTSISVVWGQRTGLTATDPDALPLQVGTAVFGQGFTGRLLATIRDTEGLTYGIGAGIDNDTFRDGDWSISGTFAPSLLDQGIASTRRELVAWTSKGITAEELDARKTNLVGIHKLQLATTGGLAGAILRIAHRGESLSRIDDFADRVRALTLDDVNTAIQRHLDPAQMVLVKAGSLPATTP